MSSWRVTQTGIGARLDRWLADRAQVSRAQVRRWLDAGAVCVDGHAVASKQGGITLRVGQYVTVEPPASCWVAPDHAPLDVLTEGPDWVAVNKPAGVPVHPLLPDEAGTLLGWVAARFPDVMNVGDEGELRSGVVHRLDTGTTGVVLFALSNPRWHQLRQAFTEHTARKRYRAIVAGRLSHDGQQEMSLKVAQHRPAKVVVTNPQQPGSRRCSLAWRVCQHTEHTTQLEVDLHTGFLHQIRVMLAAMGHPLLGDRRYATPPITALAPRPMLHAASIEVADIKAGRAPARRLPRLPHAARPAPQLIARGPLSPGLASHITPDISFHTTGSKLLWPSPAGVAALRGGLSVSCGCFMVTVWPAGTDAVMNTEPPMVAPLPMTVLPPRMIAPP